MLQQACAQAATWHSQGYRVQMSVNVSMRQIASPDLVGDVVEALAASRLDPATVTLEVTESVLMRDAEATVAHLCRLKELGVKIAIDDFGSGQSSLTYLRRFPIDEFKIDRSFIAAIDGSRESTALLHTLVELGRTLGLSIVAEGIETCSQLEGLRGEHCALRPGLHLRPAHDRRRGRALPGQGGRAGAAVGHAAAAAVPRAVRRARLNRHHPRHAARQLRAPGTPRRPTRRDVRSPVSPTGRRACRP